MTPSEAPNRLGIIKSKATTPKIYMMAGGPRPLSFLQSVPPYKIFHIIFEDFIHLVNDSDIQAAADDLKNVHELMYFALEISQMGDRHDGHNEGLRKRLRHILRVEVTKSQTLIGLSLITSSHYR